jgi:opacity protein-like surface antigen
MRSKFLVMAVAAATTLASAAAFAQGEQPPAPAPAPAPAAPVAPVLSGTLGSGGAQVTPGTTQPGQDTAKKPEAKTEEKKEKKLPWHGTTFLWSQYANTQAVGLGSDYQSSNPLYAWWLVLSPRYYLLEDEKQAFVLRARLDLTLEMTNSDSTTRRAEPEFGNIWLLALYSRTLYEDGGWRSRVTTGPRVLVPTSKPAWNSGTRLMPGWQLSASQSIPLAGKGKKWFPGFDLGALAAYAKYINNSTTAYNSDFARERMDTEGRVFVSHQIGGAAMTNHMMLTAATMDLHIHELATLSIMQYWIMSWKYDQPKNPQIQTTTGTANVQTVQDPQKFQVLTWFYPILDLDVADEISLGVGYYNLANQIGPDGKRRNMLWSPDAVVLFDITANLDAIYSDIASSKEKKAASKAARKQAAQMARQSMMQNNPGRYVSW